MKKRILITMPSMFIGGAERSLLGLLDALDTSRCDVSVFLYRHEGELMPLIPESVRLLPTIPAYEGLDQPIRVLFKKGRWLLGAVRVGAKSMLRIRGLLACREPSAFNTMYYISRRLLPFLPRISGDYDLAINFLGSNDIVLHRVSAKVKMGWIHTDYSKYNDFKSLDDKMWRRWGKVDCIVNVSDECTRIFRECFPFLAEKCITIENILPANLIREQAIEDVSSEMPSAAGETNLCSIGRFCNPKNFDAVPEIVYRLRAEGLDVKWYLIGYGPDEPLIRRKITEWNVEEQVIILGKKTNPYPYIKACDIYVQPSRFEGKAVAVREAQILGKPVLITDFPTAKSQLEDGMDGLICPLSIEGVAEGIKRLIESDELRNRLVQNAAFRDYSNRTEVEKIYHILH